jgi:hypothetical protein
MPDQSDLRSILRQGAGPPKSVKREPLWKGPEQDGITFSLLSRFLVCRERFRLLVVEGLKEADEFSHRLEYGNMWHVCEQSLAAAPQTREPGWEHALADYARGLALRYRGQAQQVDHWYRVCKTQFPIYIDYWKKHPDVVDRRPLLQEQVFDVPYKLPSGRVVKLKGKWDAVDLIGKEGASGTGVYLQENKCKGDVHEGRMLRQLTFDLQTMMYLVALERAANDTAILGPAWVIGVGNGWKIKGVRYNVIRRPLSGGKGSIVRHKPSKKEPHGETVEHFYGRVRGIIADSPEDYFFRWKVEVSPADVTRFRRQCLDPVLEQLCEWWDWVRGNPNPFAFESDPADRPGMNGIHWRHPFGVYNPLDEGRSSDLDEYLHSGSQIGLERVEDLFPELAQ